MNNLKLLIDNERDARLSGILEVFSSGKNEFIGSVGYDGFKIRKRKGFFDFGMNLAVAKGSYSQHGPVLAIHAEITSFTGKMKALYIFLSTVYLIFFITFSFSDDINGNAVGIAIPFLLFHAAIMMGIPYLIMRRSTKRLKHELEREFYYVTKKAGHEHE